MKKLLFILLSLIVQKISAQDHFGGINTSSRVGILNASVNPAELSNLSKKFEVNIYGLSINVANNIVSFKDLTSDTNLENLIFEGNQPVNLRLDGQISGPSVAMRWKKWGFGFTTKGNVKTDLVDVDPKLGNAILNGNSDIFNSTTIVNNDYNQRMSGTSWGEVGFSASRTIFENEKHKFGVGLTIKLLFPGSYSNFGLDEFHGTINYIDNKVYINNTTTNLNVAYSGNLVDSFNTLDDYTKSIFGQLGGSATDIGFNYQWKNGSGKYKINSGISIRNMGSMTFKGNNNYSTTYKVDIQPTAENPNGLNLNQFDNVNSFREIESILYEQGYVTNTPNKTDFKVKLPTVFSAYADVKIIPKVSVTLFTQQKLNSDNKNDQITTQNVISLTPRVNLGFFEAYLPISDNEISGTLLGIGFRLGGFYIGSSSAITTLFNDNKQADVYMGFRWGFL